MEREIEGLRNWSFEETTSPGGDRSMPTLTPMMTGTMRRANAGQAQVSPVGSADNHKQWSPMSVAAAEALQTTPIITGTSHRRSTMAAAAEGRQPSPLRGGAVTGGVYYGSVAPGGGHGRAVGSTGGRPDGHVPSTGDRQRMSPRDSSRDLGEYGVRNKIGLPSADILSRSLERWRLGPHQPDPPLGWSEVERQDTNKRTARPNDNLTRNAAGSPTVLELQCQCQRLDLDEVLVDVRMFYKGSTTHRTIYSDQHRHKQPDAFMEAITQETTGDNFKINRRMKLILRQGNVTSPAEYAGRYSCHVFVLKNGHHLNYTEYFDVLEPDLLPKTTATWTTTTTSTSLTTTAAPAIKSTTQALILPNEDQSGYATDTSFSKTNVYIAVGSLCALVVLIVIFLAFVFTVWQRRKRHRMTAMQDKKRKAVDSSKCWQAATSGSEDDQAAEDDTACRPDTLTRATPRQISGRWPLLPATPSGRHPVLWSSSEELERRDHQHQDVHDDDDGEWEGDSPYGNNCPGRHGSLSHHSLIRSCGRRLRHTRAHQSRQRYTWIASSDGGSLYPPDAGIEERRVTFLQYPVEGKVGPSADELYWTTFSSSEQDCSESEEPDREGKKAPKGNRLSLSPRLLKRDHPQIYRTKSAPLVVSHHHKRRPPSPSNATCFNHTAFVGRNPRSKATVSSSRNIPAKERASSHADNGAGRVALQNQFHPLGTSVAVPMLTRQGQNGRRTSKSRRNRSRNSRQGSSRSSYSEDELGDTSHQRRRRRASSTGREKGREEGRGEDNQRGERGEESQSYSSGQTSSSLASPTTFPFTVTAPGLGTSCGDPSDKSCSDQGYAGRQVEVATEGRRGRASQDQGASTETAAHLPLHAAFTSPAASRLASDSDSDMFPGLKRHKAGHCSRSPPAKDYTEQRPDTAGDPVLGPKLRHADSNQTYCKRPASSGWSRRDDDDQRCPPEPGPGGDDAVDLQTGAGAGAGVGQARGKSPVAPAVPHGHDRRPGAGRNGLGDRRDQAAGSQVREPPQTLYHHGQYPVPVDCVADVSVNGRSGPGGGASAALLGKGLQIKDSNASSSSSSGHGRRERFRGAGKDGGSAQGSGAFALLGVEVVSTPEQSGQFLHIADNHHSTTPKARLE